MSDIRAGQRVRIYRASDDTDLGIALADPVFSAQSDGLAVVTTAVGGAAASDTVGGVAAMARRQDAAGAFPGVADGEYTQLQVDSVGALKVSITGGGNASVQPDHENFLVGPGNDSVTVLGALADEAATSSVDEDDVGALRMTTDRKLLTRIVGDADANRWNIDGSGHGQVDIAAVSVTAVPVSRDGTANSETNPIYVQVVTGVVSGVEVHDYNEGVDVAKDATDTHTIAVTAATTFMVKSVIVAASGSARYELQTGSPTGTFTTHAMLFTGPGQLSFQAHFDPPIELAHATDEEVRVIRRNDDNAAQSIYSTVIGVEV
jgi:hypothetical protein